MERRRYHPLKTSGIWTPPPREYFRFLERIEKKGLPRNLAVLGCADGNYVLAAARRGFNVLALDADQVALYGGTISAYGENVEVLGLEKRLKIEGLESNAQMVCDDFISYNPKTEFSGVFTSGSIHYQGNSRIPLDQIISSIQGYVVKGGLLVIEYIHPTKEENNDPKRHFLTQRQIARYFMDPYWRITSNKKKRYLEDPNPRNPRAHNITWGKLYAERLK